MLVACVLRLHIKEHLVAEISGALRYGVPHNHNVVLAHKIRAIINMTLSLYIICMPDP